MLYNLCYDQKNVAEILFFQQLLNQMPYTSVVRSNGWGRGVVVIRTRRFGVYGEMQPSSRRRCRCCFISCFQWIVNTVCFRYKTMTADWYQYGIGCSLGDTDTG